MKKIGVGLYGRNGHQIHQALGHHAEADLVADETDLDQLLANPQVDLISLCSPRRADQARDALRCLRAGKHVYAEKPSALTEPELDEIIQTVAQTGRRFHEMAGTIEQQPYAEMRRLIRTGAIGEVVQVLAQKSYPWTPQRPADEDIDGGLGLQVGVYITRFVEHIAGQTITSIHSAETVLGNPRVAGPLPHPPAECRRAVSFQMTLANGGLASGVCNYLNPLASRCWGYEILRVFGTAGIVESNAETGQARLLREDQPPQPLAPTATFADDFTRYARSLRQGEPMPLTLAAELSPTRWVIRAREQSISRRPLKKSRC